MVNERKLGGINRRSWEQVRELSRSKFPELLVEPKKTTKGKGSNDMETMQQMFPASPIYNSELNNKLIDTQKTTLLARGTVDDGGHTFGKVDRSFGDTPGPIDFDIMSLLDISNNFFISGSIKKQQEVRKYVPRPVKSINKIVEVFAEYEEDVVYLNNQTVATINFTHNFSVAPYVVLTVEPTFDNQSNINVFGLSLPSATSVLIGTSAPFTGYIRYRAAADTSYTWPRSATSIYTSSMKIYSGEIIVVNQNNFTANFNFPVAPSGSLTILSTTYDAYFNRTANTDIELRDITPITFTQFSSTSDLSQYSTVKIHYIAFKV